MFTDIHRNQFIKAILDVQVVSCGGRYRHMTSVMSVLMFSLSGCGYDGSKWNDPFDVGSVSDTQVCVLSVDMYSLAVVKCHADVNNLSCCAAALTRRVCC